MRKVSMKRSSPRKSARENENGVSEAQNASDAENGESDNAVEDYEPAKKKRVGKRKSVTFTPKKSNAEEENNDVQYEVESIQDEKVVKGVKYYLVRWKGYETGSDSWEPENTLSCNEMIKEFHASRGSGKEKKKEKKKKAQNKSTTEENWDEKEEFEVDRILEVHYKRDGTREFLVSWKGYKSADNSWEPEENMTCPDLIAKFMQKVEKAKSASPRELREKRAHTQRFTLSSDLHGRRLSKRNVGKQRVQYHDAE